MSQWICCNKTCSFLFHFLVYVGCCIIVFILGYLLSAENTCVNICNCIETIYFVMSVNVADLKGQGRKSNYNSYLFLVIRATLN